MPRLLDFIEQLTRDQAILAETMNEAVKRYVADDKECERMRLVFEAVKAWRDLIARAPRPSDTDVKLARTVDAYLAKEKP